MCQIHQFPVYTLWQRNCIFTAWINASRADGVTLSYYEIVIFRQNFTLLIIFWIEEFWARNNATRWWIYEASTRNTDSYQTQHVLHKSQRICSSSELILL